VNKIKLLLENEADINARNNYNETPLDIANEYNRNPQAKTGSSST
jgi:ankyrin repeat protein